MNITNSNITIMIKNMDVSITFYLSLGFSVKERWDDHYAQLTGPGLTLGLHPADDKQYSSGSGNVSIGFTTNDIEETKKELKFCSIDFMERKEEGGEFLHFTDPDGTQLYFIKPKW